MGVVTSPAAGAGEAVDFGWEEEGHLLIVHVLQRLDELPCDLLRQQAVQPTRLHLEALQDGLLNILHDNACAPLVLEGVQKRDNVGMAQQFKDPHLPFHSFVHLSGRAAPCKLFLLRAYAAS